MADDPHAPSPAGDPASAQHPQFHEAGKHAGRWGTFWWTLSVVAHIAAAFCVIYFSPLRKLIFSKQTDTDTLKDLQGPRVSRMVQSMLEVQTRRLREKVKEQKGIVVELTAARDNRYGRYKQEREYMLARGGRKDLAPLEPMDVMGSPGPDANVNIENKGVEELYETAKEIEKTSYGLYRQLRACELARIQYLSLKESLDASKMAVPDHPQMNLSIIYTPVDRANDPMLEQIKNELHRVNSEVASMVSAAQRMLDLANDLIADDVGLTAGYDTGGAGPTGGGAGESDPGRTRKNIFMGYSAPDPDAFQHDWGVGVGPVVHRNELYPTENHADLGRNPPAPGRKLMSGGIKSNWMYIDTWYIVGPFPNPNRENLDKKFPPEAGALDLDATYIGMGGRRLKWEFRQSYTVCVFPHAPDNYTIYYAYSEIFSDKDQDRWCIFGSDDYGKAWLNDDLIFASGKTPHPWIPDRAYKKVRFKKGVNKLMFKLENAWGRTGFSMCVYLGEMG
jgi:hypothetical protein